MQVGKFARTRGVTRAPARANEVSEPGISMRKTFLRVHICRAERVQGGNVTENPEEAYNDFGEAY